MCKSLEFQTCKAVQILSTIPKNIEKCAYSAKDLAALFLSFSLSLAIRGIDTAENEPSSVSRNEWG
jgi:hypothetical protein